jgi:hypothetical protein
MGVAARRKRDRDARGGGPLAEAVEDGHRILDMRARRVRPELIASVGRERSNKRDRPGVCAKRQDITAVLEEHDRLPGDFARGSP